MDAGPTPGAVDLARRIADATGADLAAVRALLDAWWAWAGAVTARGEVVDSDVFLDQREAEGMLELPRATATTVIESELLLLHRVGRARRAATRRRPDAPPSRELTAALVVALALLMVCAVVFGRVVPHIALPLGGERSLVAPYQAWFGIVLAASGLSLAGVGALARPHLRDVLAMPALGLAGLLLACGGLLAGSAVLAGLFGLVFVAAGFAATRRRSGAVRGSG